MDNYIFFQREKTHEATAKALDRLRSKGIRAYVEEGHANQTGYVINVHAADMDEANKILPDTVQQETTRPAPKVDVDNRHIDETILSHMTKTWKSASQVLDMSNFELGVQTDCESRILYLIDQAIIDHQGDRSNLSSCDIRIRIKSLTAIGLWHSDENSQYVYPEDLVKVDHYVDKEKLIAYLDSGEVFQSWLGDTDCRFGCGENDLGTTDLTDGVWLWPQSLSHYIDVHDVVLPETFLSHARKNKWKVPYVCLAESTTEDDAFWIDYCDSVRSNKNNEK